MNIVTLTGRIARDIELRTTTSGKSVTTFSMAVDRTRQEGVDFFYVVAWDKTAENASLYLKKGSRVGVVGRLTSRTFEKNGEKRTIMEVVADNVEFLDSKPKPENAADGAAGQYDVVNNEDLPF